MTEEHPILLPKVTRNDNYEAFKKGRRPKKTIWNIGESIWVKACDVQKYLNEQTNYVKWCLKIPRIKSENVADEWAMRELKSCKDYYRPHFLSITILHGFWAYILQKDILLSWFTFRARLA